MHKFTMLN